MVFYKDDLSVFYSLVYVIEPIVFFPFAELFLIRRLRAANVCIVQSFATQQCMHKGWLAVTATGKKFWATDT